MYIYIYIYNHIGSSESQVYLVCVQEMEPSLPSLDTLKKFVLPDFVGSKQVGWIFFMICSNAVILITI